MINFFKRVFGGNEPRTEKPKPVFLTDEELKEKYYPLDFSNVTIVDDMSFFFNVDDRQIIRNIRGLFNEENNSLKPKKGNRIIKVRSHSSFNPSVLSEAKRVVIYRGNRESYDYVILDTLYE